jgi:hypothetical protein
MNWNILRKGKHWIIIKLLKMNYWSCEPKSVPRSMFISSGRNMKNGLTESISDDSALSWHVNLTSTR